MLVVSIGTSEDTRQYLSLDRMSATSQAQVREVSDLGDAAFAVTFSAGEALIVARRNTIVSLGAFYPVLAPEKLQSALVQVAQSALRTIDAEVRTLSEPKPHPCLLINANEASQMLQGQPVKWFFTTNSAGSSGCDYISPLGMQHRVVVGLTTDAHAVRPLYESAQRTVRQDQERAIKNLGDEAFYDGLNTVWILKGGALLHVTAFGSSILDPTCITLLHTAVARL
ncbi:MAG: hypothetical protein NVS4B9_25460 [Ktedonobacteraceae bacterium]